MKTADARTQRDLGLSELILMEHAALAVANALTERFGRRFPATCGLVLAGVGNNGGDALAVARLVAERGVKSLNVVICGDESGLSPSAKIQRDILKNLGIPVDNLLRADALKSCDWIVDGLFGTGLTREISGGYFNIIEQVNRASPTRWVVSIDIPSGLSADTGSAMGIAIRACETVTLGFMKRGLVTGEAADYVGKIRLAPIQMPRDLANEAECFWYAPSRSQLPERRPASHKGDFGHVFVWAGREETEGAAILSAEGALRTGAGLTTIVGPDAAVSALRPRVPPEVMVAAGGLEVFAEKRGSFIVGPGMGVSAESWEVVRRALESDQKLVLDADALTLIAENGDEARALLKRRDPRQTLLTPHPKEASRLLACEVAEIARDRFEAAKRLVESFPATVILKGKGTLIAAPKEVTLVISDGDPSLSKGGSGDLLCGVLAALMAQGLSGLELALGVYLHGRAAELTTQRFGTNIVATASEISESLKQAIREIDGGSDPLNA